MKELSIEKLHITVGDREIVRGLTLHIPRGEVHALMGPNGSGKSTLAKVLAGHPDYHVTAGKILMDGEDLLKLEPDERARRGLFLAFQYPSEIPGVTIANFLRAALQSRLPEGEDITSHPIRQVFPEILPQLETVVGQPEHLTQADVTISRGEKQLVLHVRIAAQLFDEELESFILTFDDITPLVAAGDDMIKPAGKLDPRSSWHDGGNCNAGIAKRSRESQ